MMNPGIREKLLAVLILPLLFLGGFVISSALSNLTDWRHSVETEETLALAVKTGAAAHYLQIERGATAGLIQSKGHRFADVLPAFRTNTDENIRVALDAFNILITDKDANKALLTAAQNAQEHLGQLESVRQNADRQRMTAEESSRYFTQTIAALLDTVNVASAALANPDAARRLAALEVLLHAKEFAGQERAAMVPVFTADRIERTQYQGLNERIGKQEAFVSAFSSLAQARHWQAYRKLIIGSTENAVITLRNRLHQSVEGFGVTPENWFSTTTARINAMLEIERMVGGDLLQWANEQADTARRTLVIAIALGVIAITLTITLGMLIIGSITRPLDHLQKTLVQIAQSGDCSLRVNTRRQDEVGRTAIAFDSMMNKISSLISDSRHSAHAIAAEALSMSRAAAQLEESAEAQSEATSAVAAAVEETSASIAETAGNARLADETAKRARSGIHLTLGDVRTAANDVGTLARMIEHTSANITHLAESSRKIDSIVQTIKEIADQTNLLALNAAIEAARAGEQGRGFAVVADEVRKLAENTGKSTSEISSLITEIQGQIDDAVIQMSEANHNAGVTRDRVATTTRTLDTTSSDTGQMEISVRNIADAMNEQANAVQQVARRMEQIAQMTEQNTVSAKSAAHTARKLDALAERLNKSVSQFRS